MKRVKGKKSSLKEERLFRRAIFHSDLLNIIFFCIHAGVTCWQTWNLSQTLHGQDFSIICLLEKRVNYEKFTFATKQCILHIHIVSHHEI